MIRPLAFAVAWLLLCGVVAVGAHQTAELVVENRAAIEQARQTACASTLAVFILANEGIAPQLPPRQAQRLRDRLAEDFLARCPGYQQAGTQ